MKSVANIKKMAERIQEANRQMELELAKYPYQEEPPRILLNGSWVFYEPISINSTSGWSCAHVEVIGGATLLARVMLSWVESVRFIPGHGV